MPYTNEGKAAMLYALGQAISHISLHFAAPPGNELTGGVYRRMRIDFLDPFQIDPVTGSIRTQREIHFELPEGGRVTHAGFWNASIDGILLAWSRTTEHRFAGRGVYVVDLAKMEI